MSFPRDVMVNTAVTVVPRVNGIQILASDSKDVELCQFAFELVARKLPWPERVLKKALEEQMHMILERMRSAGMVKP